ncbi:methionyl-tRNA formyltransferase [Macrococcus capreoli]|uniref:methionyl-tRNA formyltransferase n=1 Tax=Macrococcus capreoli TaxID=2982690 RepID=UPI0021D5928B|nr:methionyl-tRNA formyltransferase [Macrococcus sp. TMW 2.2395]MCU7556671.1 methionyl-tRNA formyltransferase [Macrococcus sp. TMW 2.2395]
MKKPNIIFMGTPDFSAPILKAVHEAYGVTHVITQPDKPVGRKRVLTAPPVKAQAVELGIEVYQPEKMTSDEAFEYVQNLNPDLIITAAYGQLLPERILNIPRLGCINVHASLLPKYRGGAPIHKAIINGEKESGVTIMYMAKKLDAGDMISQIVVPIEQNDTVGTLHDKLSGAGIDLLLETLPSILDETNERTPQNHDAATFASNVSREEEYVTFDRTSQAVHDHIRGLSPWPVGFAKLDGQNVKLWMSEIIEGHGQPGEILTADKHGIKVATNDGAVLLTEIQPAGKKRMKASDYVAGLKQTIVGQTFNGA